ncbi:MAG: response regulator [Betaproteobacteria bacterium]|nr:response regulator [Betaproteobacteria bacterium]
MQSATPASFPAGPMPATVLFVDDEQRILRSLRMLFATQFKVLMTTDPREALVMLKRETVHVLVSDQRMPIMQGVDLLRKARDLSPDTMRLLLTGYSDLEAIIDSINEGEVFRYINKPWNADELRSIVGEAAAIAVGLRTLAPAVPLRGETAQRRILLIDDAADVASGLRTMIEEGFSGAFALDWVTSLPDAMGILERNQPSMVISELSVGGDDMMPFLKLLKLHHPHIVTIVQTTFRDTGLLVELINQGQVHRFLPKPMRKAMMLRGIQSGMELAREIHLHPEVAARHRVDVPPRPADAGLVGRIRSLFRGGPASR